MQVCDVCLGDPQFGGSPTIRDTSARAEEYLFGDAHRIDLCKECRDLFLQRAWAKIAERAHDVLLLRLGVPEGKTG